MILRGRLIFYPIIFSIIAYALTQYTPPHIIPVYLAAAAMDIYQTASAGRVQVSGYECAFPFARITKRFGLIPAIVSQIILEAAIGLLLFPVLMERSLGDLESASAFCLIAAPVHLYGYIHNTLSHRKF